MFEKVIEFSAQEEYASLKEDYPEPIKLNIPEWFKNLKHSSNDKTIKGCIPFLDSLTSGYLLRIPQDIHIQHNVKNEENKKDSFIKSAMFESHLHLVSRGINLNFALDTHPINQLEGSPLIEKNNNLPFYKILNPWTIKTPKGYSCLFVSPLNNSDDRFFVISGIVDTDVYPSEINFPIVINGDKYSTLNTILEKGTPYVQVIPFKRDNWKMKISTKKRSDIIKNKLFLSLQFIQRYKNKYWSKKTWK
jgi:hypothetical protein